MHDLWQNISTFMDYNHLISEVYVATVDWPTYDLMWWAQPKEVLPLTWLPYGGVVRGKLYTNSTFSSPSLLPKKLGKYWFRLDSIDWSCSLSHSTIMVYIHHCHQIISDHVQGNRWSNSISSRWELRSPQWVLDPNRHNTYKVCVRVYI